ncbi:molybdopterin oxidoreductase family protein [Dongshaea marina]|uniref:molybdopterin oxidoreductase family protein n=1 Tax=Dongshaea marina TaxID=2047966 RepID=UPI002D766269|nr:molybdopterin oxidoreductase family protein [Dongshaea marina]
MNTQKVREMLVDKSPDGHYKIPFLVVCDAFQSEMTAFADLILPDTTYLERHDVMSMLDRPISEYDGPVDSVRIPVLPPTGECKPFQDVLIELGSRLKLPAFTTEQGEARYSDYCDFITNYQTAPSSGVGFLMGWRGKDGKSGLRGEPNPNQWRQYAENNCYYHHKLPPGQQFMRNCNSHYLDFAKDMGFRADSAPALIQIYSEVLQKFRLAALGQTEGRRPPARLAQRIVEYFDPLPFWYPSLESQQTDNSRYPLFAVTQRPMAMYHSWDSQNAWLRQIHGENPLYIHPATAEHNGIRDGDWILVESQWGQVRCQARYSEAVNPNTVWTWNAIGKAPGAWLLSKDASEASRGFLLNHLISEELPACEQGVTHYSNSDPITGQAGWYDVKVRLSPVCKDELSTQARPSAMQPLPGTVGVLDPRVQGYRAGQGIFSGWLKRMMPVQRKS